MPPSITQIPFKKFTWHNLTANGEEEIRWLRDNFAFAPAHLIDCATPPLRPKIEFAPEYVFVVLLFPLYNRKTGQISSREIDVFLGKNFLVTAHTNEVSAIKDLAQKTDSLPETRARYEATNPLPLFLGLLEELLDSLFPMLNHVAWDIDTLDNELFSGQERLLIHKILSTKKNIVDIRKSMQGYHNVLSELSGGYHEYFGTPKLEKTFGILITKSRDLWDQIENHKATIDAVRQTNESLISFRLSHIMKTLTILSVMIFPLTLLAAIFGMNVEGGMPFLRSGAGFWKIIFLMIVLSGGMLYYFKKHRWL